MKRYGIVGKFAFQSLVFVIVMGGLLGIVLTVAVRSVFIENAGRTAQTMANAIVLDHIGDIDLGEYPVPGDLKRTLDVMLDEDLSQAEITTIKLWNDQGVLLYSSDGEDVGESFAHHPPVAGALSGTVQVELATKADDENRAQFERDGRVIEVYAPLTRGDEVIGVFEIYQRYAPLASTMNQLIALVWLIIFAGSVPAYFLQLRLVQRTADELVSTEGALAKVNDRLRRSLEDMELHSLGTLQALVAAVDAKDSYTARHSIAVTDYAVAIARRLGLSEADVVDIERAGLLHDVGKIGTPEAILLKPDKLSDEEFETVTEHSAMGGHIIESVPFLAALMPTIRSHHERWDGSGYPDGLAGEQIPLGARILSVADAFDAMTSERPYRLPVSIEVARAELVRCENCQFDANVVQAMLAALDGGDAQVVVHAEAVRRLSREAVHD